MKWRYLCLFYLIFFFSVLNLYLSNHEKIFVISFIHKVFVLTLVFIPIFFFWVIFLFSLNLFSKHLLLLCSHFMLKREKLIMEAGDKVKFKSLGSKVDYLLRKYTELGFLRSLWPSNGTMFATFVAINLIPTTF